MDARTGERLHGGPRGRRVRDRHRQRPPLQGHRGPALARRPGDAAMTHALGRRHRGPDRRGRDAGHARSRHPPRSGLLAALRAARRDRRDRPGGGGDALAVRAAPRRSPRPGTSASSPRRRAASTRPSSPSFAPELAPSQVSEVTSAVADALIARMIELGVESQGPPPAEFCWMSLGSHGRREPVPSSDVDSGMAWRDVPEQDPLIRGTARSWPRAGRGRTCAALAAHVCRLRQGDRLAARPARGDRLGAFSASSIEDWERAIQGWLTRPERQPGADRDLDPARRARRLRADDAAST